MYVIIPQTGTDYCVNPVSVLRHKTKILICRSKISVGQIHELEHPTAPSLPEMKEVELAQYGADCIKVERRGETYMVITRNWP